MTTPMLILLLLAGGARFEDRSAEAWAGDLEGKDRETAVRALVDGEDEAIPVLLEILRMRNRRAPRWASRILLELPPVAADRIPYSYYRMRIQPSEEHARELLKHLGVPGAIRDGVPVLHPLGERGVALLLEKLRAADPNEPRAWRERQAIYSALCQFGPMAEPALPELVAELKRDHYAAGQEAIRAVGAIGPTATAAVPELIRILESSRWHLHRGRAATALGAIGDVRAIPPLAKGLVLANQTDVRRSKVAGPESTRRAIAWALAEFGPKAKTAVPAMKGVLGAETQGLRVATALAILSTGEERRLAFEVLARELRATDDWFLVDQITEALGDLGEAGAPAVPALAAKLEAADWVSSRCAFALARIGEPARKALPAIATAMERDANRAAIYAFAFWMLGGDRKRALTRIEATNDAYYSLSFAVRALDQLGDEGVHALPLILRWLPEYHRDEFVRILCRLGPKAKPAVPGLLTLLDSPWHADRRAAATVLGAIGSEKAVSALLDALMDRRPEVRVAAARALAKLRAEAAVPTLVRLLHDPILAPEAMDALVTIGAPSVEPILRIPPDTRKAVRERALETLIRLEREHRCVVPVLLVPPHGGPGHRIAEERLVAMGQAAVPGLTRAAEGDDEGVAKRAAWILRRIRSRQK